MLATASLGAIWSSASPDFGVSGVLDRFKQISPKILISTNAVKYNGKSHNHLDKLKSVVAELPSIEKTIVFPFVEPINEADLKIIPKSVLASYFLSPFPLVQPRYAQLPFDHPLVIVFSSGTTGQPKCIVHSHGVSTFNVREQHYSISKNTSFMAQWVQTTSFSITLQRDG
jgi:acetoacetyl-CoA synthetase